MHAIIFMGAVEKKKAIKKLLEDMKKDITGAKLSLDFYKGYSAGYLDALYQNALINKSQFDYLRRCK